MLKIKLSINLEIIIFILVFIFTRQIKLYLAFLLYILLHELGHMIVGVAFGFKIKKITLMPFGFNIEFKKMSNKGKNNIKEIITEAAGPIVNLLLMLFGIVLKLNINMIYINLALAVFNLLPIYPLDGGRILKSFLSVRLKKIDAYKIANKVSNICLVIVTAICSILILYIKNLFIVLVIVYLWIIVIRENKKYKTLKRMYIIMEKTDKNFPNYN